MGKSEDEQQATALPNEEQNPYNVGWIRCVFTFMLALSVLISALFWIPPFLHRGGEESDRDRDQDLWSKANIAASFRLQKPVGLLQANVVKLQYDIYEEIGVPDSSVSIISLDPIGGSNWTNVVFGIWPYPEKSSIPSTALSLLRSSFMSLAIRQSTLHLTTALFGNSSMFEVLKFPGGITIIPVQNVFLLQKPQTLFNFTLNFPINQVQNKVGELKGQMKSGLLLNSNENLYFRLTNLEGSTITPPTIVQTSIVLAVGNHPPSLPRLKQLAQNIRNSSAGNLGLNHTVFGRVKQIQLSSFLQHSLNSTNSTGTPSPSPQPHPGYHHHHHHSRHHHHHNYDGHIPPVPTPAPSPEKTSMTPAPSRCQHGISRKPRSKGYPDLAAPAASPRHMVAPAAAPNPSASVVSASHKSPAPSSSQRRSPVPSTPLGLVSPPVHNKAPAQAPNFLPAPPFSVVSFSHARPPSESVIEGKPPDIRQTTSPALQPSSSPEKCFVHWVLVSMLYLIMSL